MKTATINKFGNDVCPHCHANIIPNPDIAFSKLRQCGVCSQKFKVKLKRIEDGKKT